jgi:hypothetical protein
MSLPGFGLPVARMSVKGAGLGKLAQFVTDHVLANEDRDEFLAIVDCDCVTHKLWQDGRSP